MFSLLAREYTRTGEPTGWAWYTDGDKVLSVSFSDDVDWISPDHIEDIYPLKEFIKYQGIKTYGEDGVIVCDDPYDEPDFAKIFGNDASDDEYCIVVYDRDVYRKMLRVKPRRQ